VDWKFKCLFIPGNYFIDSGIRMLTNETQMVLAKITDAAVFKVMDDDCPQKGGFFDSFQNVEINKLQESPRG
jgi:hypothetical protein